MFYRGIYIIRRISGMETPIQNCFELKQENEKVLRCLAKLEPMESDAKKAQIIQISDKYKFFLRKYQKLLIQHRKHQQAYLNIAETVESSQPVREEKERIAFIKMISSETENQVKKLVTALEEAQLHKKAFQHKISLLKQTLLQKKKEYFRLRRKQDQLLHMQEDEEFAFNQVKQENQMYRIRAEKRERTKQKNRIPKLEVKNLQLEPDRQSLKLLQSFENIDAIKHAALKQANASEHSLLSSTRAFHIKQKHQNKQILLKGLSVKMKSFPVEPASDQQLLNRGNYLIFTQVQATKEEREKFKQLTSDQILNLIIKNNKIEQVLALIQNEKKPLLSKHHALKKAKIL